MAATNQVNTVTTTNVVPVGAIYDADGNFVTLVGAAGTPISFSGGAGSFTTLSASSTVTFSGGTANGVAYLNGSKVLTTGSALSFDGTNLGLGGNPNSTGIETGVTRLFVVAPNSNTGTAATFIADSVGRGISVADQTKTNSFGINITSGLATIGGNTSGTSLAFNTSATERMRLDSSGNLGLGVTPSAWGTFSSIFQGVGYSLAGFSSGSNVQSSLSCNSFFNGTNYIYRGSAAASQYLQISGSHQWFNAASGTAGNAITFTQAMTLDASGNLGIGTTANASAILDAQSTTKGVRMPNMTTTQKNAISSPAAGLMVFDTTLAKLCVYSGSAWQTITSV